MTITNDLLQHVIDYTPYEGLEVTGWPVATVRRGEIVMRDGKVQAEPGSGQFLARAPYDDDPAERAPAGRVRRQRVSGVIPVSADIDTQS